MREFARIDRILARLEVYWKRNPDLRLGQILVNLHGEFGEMLDPGRPPRVFDFEDSDLEIVLAKQIDLLTRVAAAAAEDRDARAKFERIPCGHAHGVVIELNENRTARRLVCRWCPYDFWMPTYDGFVASIEALNERKEADVSSSSRSSKTPSSRSRRGKA
jgi:hypothetical protein